jgi:nitroreductase
MELRQIIELRSSVRRFKNEPLPLENLLEMVRLAGLSPSVNNSQPWKFHVVTNKTLMAAMAQAVRKELDRLLPSTGAHEENVKSTVEFFSTFFKDAPALIAVATQPYEAVIDKLLSANALNHEEMNEMRNHPDLQSIGACVQTLLLTAVDMGYGACWLSSMLVARRQLESMLRIQMPWQLASFVAVGKPAGVVRPREKKTLSEILEIID